MTLYRLGDTKARLPEDVEWSKAMTAYVNALIDQEVLVPVEPCEHGKIDSHLFYVKYDDGVQVYHPNGVAIQEPCPGAGIGGTP